MKRPSTVSIVINTIDRASLLDRVLGSLDWLDPAVPFEVVVVVGPSRDHTDEVVARWGERIKLGRVERPNLSASRNEGIRLSAGDVVAFIDDDAVPEAEWLVDLLAAYDNDVVGAAGGWVYDHTGMDFQYRYGLVDRLGHARPAPPHSTLSYSFPGAFVFPHLLGTNSSFLRSALLEVGGFDEEYEYFLDESDVLIRVVDAGYRVHHVEGAYVHHKFAPSAIRLADRFARDRFSIVKNHVYFARRNAAEHLSTEEITQDIEKFLGDQRREMADGVARGLITADELETFDRRALVARKVGEDRAAVSRRLLADGGTGTEFSPFRPTGRRERVVFYEADTGRSANAMAAARDFARSGGVAHVIVPATGHPNVDFVDGVWVHSIVNAGIAHATAAEREVKLIKSRRRVDEVRTLGRRRATTRPVATIPTVVAPEPPREVREQDHASIVIATWRLFDELRDCLDALSGQIDAPPFDVTVVLNGSPDPVLDMTRRHPVVDRVIPLEANVGFGAAANLGAAAAEGEWVVFLNDDAIPDPHWLGSLTASRVDGERPAAVMSLLLNFDGTIQEAGSRILSHGGTVQLGRGLRFEEAKAAGFLEPRRIDYGSAAALAVRRTELLAIGGFSPGYEPAYFEDVDLQLRLAERGGFTWFEPSAKVTHHLGRSTESDHWFRMWAAARSGRLFVSTWGHVLGSAAELDDPVDVVASVPPAQRVPPAMRKPAELIRASPTIAMEQSRAFQAWLIEQLEEARAGILEIAPVGEGPTRQELVRRNAELLSRLADLERRGPIGVARARFGLFLQRHRLFPSRRRPG